MERFSLLVLDPGEIYFEDFSATLVTPETTIETFDSMKIEGHLKLSSKSLVFDPKDLIKPLIKIPLKDIKIIEKWQGSSKFIEGENIVRIETDVYIEMLERNIIAPYKFCDNGKFIISLNYSNINHCLPQITQLMRASTLPAFEQADMISVIVHSRQARIQFDPLWMDLHEKVQLECQASKIAPLVVNPGQVVLTNKKLYFQPYNNIEANLVIKIHLSSIKQVFKRRFLLRHTGLEIYFSKGFQDNEESHLYISLHNQSDRDKFYDLLMGQEELNLSNNNQDVMTLQWQNGLISNYEYLLYINSLGDRSKNDLTQYPVFPWVILEYNTKSIDLSDKSVFRDLKKPIGALNNERLAKLMERYWSDEMSHPKFIYGSHYSNPGFVLYYLVRLYPHYMLCLQNGRFDHPDRMFNSCLHLCKNVLNDTSDFKELIPEFFDLEQGGSFLQNNFNIDFGCRESGAKVGDVELPLWAESPKHFVKTLREALESDYVSENINHWIDLIFGFKQRGEEAINANNLFHHLCYEGSVDLDEITDRNERHILEVQIMEFGQIPKQVFQVPHPKRRKPLQFLREPQINSSTKAALDSSDAWHNMKGFTLVNCFDSHKEKVADLFLTDESNKVVSVGSDSKLKVFSLDRNRQVRSTTLGNMPLSCCTQLPNTNVLIIGTLGSEILLYDLDFGKTIQGITSEDAVSCIAWAFSRNMLCAGSGDCVRVWKASKVEGKLKSIEYLLHQLNHSCNVTTMSFNKDERNLAVGTQDGDIYIWKICDDQVSLKKYPNFHSKSITCLSYSPDGHKLVSCSLDQSFQVLDLNTGMSLFKKNCECALNCLKWDGYLLVIGADNGKYYLWNIDCVQLLKEVQAHNDSITCIDLCQQKGVIVTGSKDHKIKVWVPESIEV